MKRRCFMIILALSALIACGNKQDGVYITYDIDTSDRNGDFEHVFQDKYMPWNENLSRILLDKFKGRKYDITYQEKFAILKNQKENQEIIMASHNIYLDGDSIRYYSCQIQKNNSEKFDLQLWPETIKNDGTKLLVEFTSDDFNPADSSGSINYAKVICYLSKLEK